MKQILKPGEFNFVLGGWFVPILHPCSWSVSSLYICMLVQQHQQDPWLPHGRAAARNKSLFWLDSFSLERGSAATAGVRVDCLCWLPRVPSSLCPGHQDSCALLLDSCLLVSSAGRVPCGFHHNWTCGEQSEPHGALPWPGSAAEHPAHLSCHAERVKHPSAVPQTGKAGK